VTGTVGVWGGINERTRVGMQRFRPELFRRSRLDDKAEVHDGGSVGHMPDDGQVVRDQEHTNLKVLGQAHQEVGYLGLDGRVQCG
jgi:hypothetical protein